MRYLIQCFIAAIFIFGFAGCREREGILVTPSSLIVSGEAQDFVVTTSGAVHAECRYTDDVSGGDGLQLAFSSTYTQYIPPYEGAWFSVSFTEKAKEIRITLSENDTAKERSLYISLDNGDVFNRFSLIQKNL